MRYAIILAALFIAGCSKVDPSGPRAAEETAAALDGSDNAASGPDIAPTALAGVAMNYAYSFRLPVERLAATQEQHAMQCEALGPTRCRIVAMRYHTNERRWISASLSVKLAPDLARRYGKQGLATVVANGGMLTDSEISSTDAGITVDASRKASASVATEQARIEAQLRQKGLGSTERSQLQARLAELSDRTRGIEEQGANAALLLASTPLQFSYVSGEVDNTLGEGPMLGGLKDGWANVVSGGAILLTIVITLLPWAIAAALAIWLWRRFIAKWLKPRNEE